MRRIFNTNLLLLKHFNTYSIKVFLCCTWISLNRLKFVGSFYTSSLSFNGAFLSSHWNDLYCVEWGVKLYSLTHLSSHFVLQIVGKNRQFLHDLWTHSLRLIGKPTADSGWSRAVINACCRKDDVSFLVTYALFPPSRIRCRSRSRSKVRKNYVHP